MFSLFPSLLPDPSQGLEQFVATNRFEEVFAAPALHGADDQEGLGVGGERKDRGPPQDLVDPFRCADCVLAVLVEINDVDVRPLQQNLVVVLSHIVLKFGSQLDRRERSYGISKLAQCITVQGDGYQGKGFANL
jgi:hypothetical protein